ncbi:hypothetical protein EVAR_58085_1 [Eumeta japonica]|uniref:Uncharacterized protein n=1 Tax=Eumeta variegata TaxID=151549 RepID=A0A4C1ZCT6_EUMVA|nr:hypothetical protein EVAR_58085_1 [Eumeta japonica]
MAAGSAPPSGDAFDSAPDVHYLTRADAGCGTSRPTNSAFANDTVIGYTLLDFWEENWEKYEPHSNDNSSCPGAFMEEVK